PQGAPQLYETIDDLISLLRQGFRVEVLIPPALVPVPHFPREPSRQPLLDGLPEQRGIDRDRGFPRGQGMNQTTRMPPVPLIGQGTGPVEQLIRLAWKLALGSVASLEPPIPGALQLNMAFRQDG